MGITLKIIILFAILSGIIGFGELIISFSLFAKITFFVLFLVVVILIAKKKGAL